MAVEFIEDTNLRILKVVVEDNMWIASIDPRFFSIVYLQNITLSALEHDVINNKMKELGARLNHD